MSFKFIRVRSISDLSVGDSSSYNITRLPIFMLTACQELIFYIREGDREDRKKESKGKEYLNYRVGISMKFIAKLKYQLVQWN